MKGLSSEKTFWRDREPLMESLQFGPFSKQYTKHCLQIEFISSESNFCYQGIIHFNLICGHKLINLSHLSGVYIFGIITQCIPTMHCIHSLELRV